MLISSQSYGIIALALNRTREVKNDSKQIDQLVNHTISSLSRRPRTREKFATKKSANHVGLPWYVELMSSKDSRVAESRGNSQ
jgi:hypothetical protein